MKGSSIGELVTIQSKMFEKRHSVCSLADIIYYIVVKSFKVRLFLEKHRQSITVWIVKGDMKCYLLKRQNKLR